MTWLQFAIAGLQVVFNVYKINGAPAEILSEVEAAIARLQAVQGQELTFENLEALRVPIPNFKG